MIDYLTRPCPCCGGRLYVDVQYQDEVLCDTCEYQEPTQEKTNG